MKRLFVLLMAAITMLVVLPLSGNAAQSGKPTVSVSSAQGDTGSDVTVQVSLSDNPGLTAFRFSLDYDSAVLELKKAEFPTLFSSPASGGNPSADPYLISWYSVPSVDESQNGVFAVLTFHIKEGVKSGTTKLHIDYDPLDVCDRNFRSVTLDKQDGQIDMTCRHIYDSFGVGCTKCGAHRLSAGMQTRPSTIAKNAYDFRFLVQTSEQAYADADHIEISLIFMDADGKKILQEPISVMLKTAYYTIIAGDEIVPADPGNCYAGVIVSGIPKSAGVAMISGSVTFFKTGEENDPGITYQIGTATLDTVESKPAN